MSLGADAIQQFGQALAKGYAITPKFHEPPSKEERDSQIEIISRVLAQQYTLFPKRPILHWKSIYLRVVETIQKEKQLGLWKYKIPEIESIRRSINYSADPRRFPNEPTPAICTTPGFYCINPQRFDDETKVELIKRIEELKASF